MTRSTFSRALAVALMATGALTAHAQTPRGTSLSEAERAVTRAVDTENARTLALLQRLVEINSGTMNFAGVRQVGDVLRAELDSLGFSTRWVDGTPFHRAGHLLAEHRGPGPKLLLIGHLDTVFEPSSPFQHFERLNDSTARGPGVIDMKGGDVIIVAALRALRAAALLDSLNVTIVYDGDEEDSGTPLTEARRTLIEAAQGAAVAIGFEDGPGDPHVAVIARRGDESWTLRTTGTPAHSSQIFQSDVGAGAIYEASRVLNEFYRQLADEQYLTFNPGLALGGTSVALDSTGVRGSAEGKTNVVAAEMTVTGDLRTISPEQLARAKRAMQTIVSKHLPHTTATLTFEPGYPPMAPTAGNKRLLAMYDRVSRDLGLWPVTAVDPSKAGAADVSFVAAVVPLKIDGIGLSGRDDHTTGETADLRMLPVQIKRAAILLHRLSTQHPESSDRE
jgi:glutamate carboxypeptidase